MLNDKVTAVVLAGAAGVGVAAWAALWLGAIYFLARVASCGWHA